MAMRSVGPEQAAPRPKKRRIPMPQQRPLPTTSKLTLGETGGLFDDHTRSQYVVDLSPAASHNGNILYNSTKVTANNERPRRPSDPFTIAIICALRCELEAVIEVLDSPPIFEPHDGEDYAFLSVRLASRRVLLLAPPNIGVLDTALAVQHLKNKFGKIELVLLVGIYGAIAIPGKDSQSIFFSNIIISDLITKYIHAAGMHLQGVK
ncbi:uncharacterized protein TRUGW13939_02449 [Talaromyces rugulosus]|uniref:Nucleoside phosphorylase domain-containing protein n=1 Tax=Talaromyces rugulosus TaxID=121627 RepID=A0A7H8QN27_TALRU|nr:uncharacterized protein TRUGW13939_02449 [Talaromyces rugulosus]QKX55357.1 hypothetical protein TRUGW13939_02449 [Talaromyces rugulosus]